MDGSFYGSNSFSIFNFAHMKIAILSPFYPYRGGIAQFSNSLYKALEKAHEVSAFSFTRLYPDFLFPGKTQYVEKEDKMLSDIPVVRILDSINPYSYRKTIQAIAAFQPDVLIVAYWMSFFVPAYASIACRLKKKMKIIALVHNAIPHESRFFDRPLARLFFRQCTCFFALSKEVQKDLLQMRPNAVCIVQPHPLYDHFGVKIRKEVACERLELDPKKKTLLFFGLIRDYKGLDLLIDAMASTDESYQLIIAGESYGDFGKYQQQIDLSPAQPRIKVLNRYIADNEVPLLFSATDFLVTPYRSATQSGVIPIAYHFEVPVLATDVGGLKEAVERTGTGLICQPTATSLAEGIQKIFQSDRNVFVANIQKEKKALSWKNFAETLINFVKTL
jgi:glycosyltransferase involved in cell wall biosynthesis